MKSIKEILSILEKLEHDIADKFEDQDLDFKEWVSRHGDKRKNDKESIDIIVENCVSMANGGGGSLVVGVRDKLKGREKAILGVPVDIDQFEIMKKVFDRTDPHITPQAEIIDVDYGTGKILVVNILAGNPPYTQTDGSAKIRIGKSSEPLTGSIRGNILTETGDSDFTAELTNENYKDVISPSAMEKIREIMEKERAADELKAMSDEDLLNSIGALRENKLTKGALLLVGKEQSIQKYIPYYSWGYRKMLSDTDYSIKDGANTAISIGLYDIERYVDADNPITTIEVGFVHPEIYMYPKIALREAILNAFLHRDFRVSGSTLVKQYKNRIEITNPGSFIGGITPDNILHHPSKTRNPHLADLMDKLKLVNRSNLGVPRIYKALLIEGKEPPQYREIGKSIELIINASNISIEFINLLSKIIRDRHNLDVDHLIILNYLIKHREIDLFEASRITQRGSGQAREVLSYMENNLKIIESSGAIRNKIYIMSSNAYDILGESTEYYRDRSLDDASMRLTIVSTLKNKEKLTNAEIRQITGLDRKSVIKLMKTLEEQGVKLKSAGRGSYYYLDNN
ncbi:ATP-binding protein [Romboutsia sedimentorum]|uniref:ATP-binding protein n=1 Tax=Romboutsia sedimentorum TaxID=1368474 RepID=A0ABT7E8N1_9FIRM|nr:ATP-binding protein [Romboutsia sedimentorum]MDK2563284.1 ATP-binding protein [Romboutsia sedimentorum]